MKNALRGFIAALCAVLAFSVVGCGGDKPQENNKPGTEMVKPVTTNDFLIGSWVSYYAAGDNVMSMSEQTARLADAGLNFLPAGGWIPDYGEPVKRDLGSAQWWQHVDSVMQKNNMLYFFTSSSGDPTTHVTIPNSVPNDSMDGLANAEKILPLLKNCAGIQLTDEPRKEALKDLGLWAREYVGIKDGAYPFVNLLPSYAGYTGAKAYSDYLESWIKSAGTKNIEYLSHDYYCLTSGGTAFSIFADMEVMRKLGLKYNLKTHAFPQACGWGDMRNPTADEIRWNVYAYIAYGFKAISYFNYAMWLDEGCFDALIALDGEIRDVEKFEAVKQMNWDIRATSNIIMNLDCMHAYHTKSLSDVETLPSDFVLQPQEGSNLIISDMAARDGTEPYFMIFNKSLSEKTEVTFTLGENSGIEALDLWEPRNKTYTSVDITDGTFNLSFDEGEGKFLRITKNVVTE